MVVPETHRLVFRPHEACDEAAFVEMHMDPEVRRYVGGAAWAREKATERFRTQYLGRPTKTYGLWAMILKDERRYVGCCGLAKHGSDANLAYYVSRPDWGRGIASEASSAFLELAFDRLRLSQVVADVESGNHVSEHILQKLGFNFARAEQIPNSRRVICRYELLDVTWRRLRS